MKKVKVLKDVCIGCGACQAICSEVYEIGDDGLAEVILEEIPEKLEEDAIDALENCPTSAIVEVEEQNKEEK
ncbi:MAG: ferredoxin [Firmicutes bacterium]|nr:ferredoxin [Bacillota bacterium]